MIPPIMKPPDELRALGMPDAVIALSERQYREWADAPHCCGARGFGYESTDRCPACERMSTSSGRSRNADKG